MYLSEIGLILPVDWAHELLVVNLPIIRLLIIMMDVIHFAGVSIV